MRLMFASASRNEDLVEEVDSLRDLAGSVTQDLDSLAGNVVAGFQFGVLAQALHREIDPVRFPEQRVVRRVEFHGLEHGELDADHVLHAGSELPHHHQSAEIHRLRSKHGQIPCDLFGERSELVRHRIEFPLRLFLFAEQLAPFEIERGKHLAVELQVVALAFEVRSC